MVTLRDAATSKTQHDRVWDGQPGSPARPMFLHKVGYTAAEKWWGKVGSLNETAGVTAALLPTHSWLLPECLLQRLSCVFGKFDFRFLTAISCKCREWRSKVTNYKSCVVKPAIPTTSDIYLLHVFVGKTRTRANPLKPLTINILRGKF